MKNSDFDKFVPRGNTDSLKHNHDFYTSHFPDAPKGALPFWVADMDFETAECIRQALQKRAEHGIYGYTGYSDTFFERVSWWQKTRHNVTVQKQEISILPGVIAGLACAVRAFTNSGDGVIIQRPVYPPFADVVVKNGRKIVDNALVFRGNKYAIDFDDLEKKAQQPSTKMLILCNPHNPVGRVWTKQELEKIGDICCRNGVFVVSDEIHSDLILHQSEFTSYASLGQKYTKNAVVCASASKTFNLAGLLLGYAITQNLETKQKFDAKVAGIYYLSHVFGVVGTQSAYSGEGAAWVDSLCEYLSGNADYIEEFLRANLPKAVYNKPQATYLAWIDLSAYISPENLHSSLTKGGLLVNSGESFGEGGEGFIRLNFACSKEYLDKGLRLLLDIIEKKI